MNRKYVLNRAAYFGYGVVFSLFLLWSFLLLNSRVLYILENLDLDNKDSLFFNVSKLVDIECEGESDSNYCHMNKYKEIENKSYKSAALYTYIICDERNEKDVCKSDFIERVKAKPSW